ncbi:MAG: 16S rRNA (cytidine(1402)-2'-O)-methyltransferase [Actinomycetota bacterium]
MAGGVTGTLYLVGTPIGNLEDITDRARRILRSVDLVAAEDTRRTGRLLRSMGISARLVSFFEGNERARTEEVVAALRDGSNVAVVSDAGMPGVSDPGYRLVSACVEAGIPVDVAPGPSAVLAALVISGLPTDRFVFEGFLPRSGRPRAERMAAVGGEPRTVVLFESPRRVARTLKDLLEFGDRRVALVRELTKLHQEVIRGTLSEVLEQFRGRDPKGEIALVLEGAAAERPALEDAVEVARRLTEHGLTKREAARRARDEVGSGIPVGDIYRRLTEGAVKDRSGS